MSKPGFSNKQVRKCPSDVNRILSQFSQNGSEIDGMKPIIPLPSENVDCIQNRIHKKPEGIIKLIRKKQLRPSLNLMNTIGG